MSVPLEITGPLAPPRANGELVFAEPWESRAFAMAMTLTENGFLTWRDFQTALVARIEAWQTSAEATRPPWRYYDHWLAALEEVLVAAGHLRDGDVAARLRVLAGRPVGHDHR
ncbi:nitrile hydratase accessory protein [Mycolicibacterium rufum]|uniref:Nitrile hydratase accessory protein n=1 Tax=Mycolicibacterium rufum TaxID=318424 RepID=A0A9X3BQ92_9MYCO|nr:nitrile hydratase accessory protein [Mycolicibacterium rufum]KGI69569.1 hypothetical protein EU78_21410 [Mycolicibacterium rufum]MCV7072282.1 nitrile hydratase accessory protein [Mycolicibacterium rufum]ULP35798.1 nitrile hydratase accessory protein [Mycolicibacterium rufum]